VRAKSRKFRSSNPAVASVMFLLDILINSIMLILDSTFTKGQLKKSFKETTATNATTTKNEKDNKFKKPCFNVSIRIATKSKDKVIAEQTAKSITTIFKSLDDENTLRPVRITYTYISERELSKSSMKNSAINAQ